MARRKSRKASSPLSRFRPVSPEVAAAPRKRSTVKGLAFEKVFTKKEARIVLRKNTGYVRATTNEIGCKLWAGGLVNGKPYGIIHLYAPRRYYRRPAGWTKNGKTTSAHRFAFFAYHGRVAKGEVSHLCHNPLCIAEEHLWDESHTDNEARKNCLGDLRCPTTQTLIRPCVHEPRCVRPPDPLVFCPCESCVGGITDRTERVVDQVVESGDDMAEFMRSSPSSIRSGQSPLHGTAWLFSTDRDSVSSEPLPGYLGFDTDLGTHEASQLSHISSSSSLLVRVNRIHSMSPGRDVETQSRPAGQSSEDRSSSDSDGELLADQESDIEVIVLSDSSEQELSDRSNDPTSAVVSPPLPAVRTRRVSERGLAARLADQYHARDERSDEEYRRQCDRYRRVDYETSGDHFSNRAYEDDSDSQ